MVLLDNSIKILNIFESYYKNLKVKNLFVIQQNKKSLLRYGFICPGALKTIEFLNKNKQKFNNDIYEKIRSFTDGLFFLELIVLYSKYINKDLVDIIKGIIGDKHCVIAKAFVKIISEEFTKLPKSIFQSLPDDFYHLRHKTLICSNDEKMVEERIKMLNKFYKEKYTNLTKNINICDGKRDGVSGCRDCCRKHFGNTSKYNKCVDSCMTWGFK